MPKSTDELRQGFFEYHSIDPKAAIEPGAEQAFYAKFVTYVWLASNGPSPTPAMESLYGGFLKSRGMTADTPVADEVSFYDGFIAWVQNAAASAPKNPYQPGTRENPMRARTQGGGAF